MTWRKYFLSLGILCAAPGIYVVINRVGCLDCIYVSICFLLSGVFLHLWTFQTADNMNFKGLMQFYIETLLIKILGLLWARKFKIMCKDVQKTQTKALKQFLEQGKTTIYGQDAKMADIQTVNDFLSHMRLTTYDDYKAYVERCLAGEKNILFPQEVTFVGATSGTTSGKSKLYPMNRSVVLKRTMPNFLAVLVYVRKAMPHLSVNKFVAAFMVPSKLQTTELGVSKGSLSSQMLNAKSYECTPLPVKRIYDEDKCFYVQLVFSLRETEVNFLFTMTTSHLLKIFSLVERKWEQLLEDVRFGTLDPNLDIPEDVRSELEGFLTPRPERADELAAIFKTGFKLFVPKVWSDLKAVSAMSTGPFAIQGKVITDLYLGPNIPIFSTAHISTEGMYGVLLYDQGLYYPHTRKVRDDYTIVPDINFYEFIPIENVDEDEPQTKLAHQVMKGEVYEMVITNFRGLYRYRTGDIVRICGYYGNTPRYQILQRLGEVLNLHAEKVPEAVFREAITEAINEWTLAKLVSYAVTENIHVDKVTDATSDKMYYVVFVETIADVPLTEEDKTKLDKHLNRLSDTYRAFRNRGTISPPQIIHVTRGTFELIKDAAAKNNSLLSRMQYKQPRIIRSEERLKILLNNQV